MTVVPFFKAPLRPVKRVFIHCSDSDIPAHDNIATIRKWHAEERGFKDDWGKPEVGYHYFIRKNGLIEHGRHLESSPDAQAGHNKGTIAICLSGRALNKFTDAQFNALRDLVRQIHDQLPMATYHGHKEVNAGKSCPVFDYTRVLGLTKRGELFA